MINVDMRLYDYFTIGEPNAYGQAQLPSNDAEPEGKVKMAIYTSSQSIQDNINYQDCSYIGLTLFQLTDKHIIQYGNERLKVLYVNPRGRFKQVFLQRI